MDVTLRYVSTRDDTDRVTRRVEVARRIIHDDKGEVAVQHRRHVDAYLVVQVHDHLAVRLGAERRRVLELRSQLQRCEYTRSVRTASGAVSDPPACPASSSGRAARSRRAGREVVGCRAHLTKIWSVSSPG